MVLKGREKLIYGNENLISAILVILGTLLSMFPVLILKDGGSWTFFSLLALWLMALYLRRGNPLCLFSALALLAHFGHAFIRRRVGRRLFDGRA